MREEVAPAASGLRNPRREIRPSNPIPEEQASDEIGDDTSHYVGDGDDRAAGEDVRNGGEHAVEHVARRRRNGFDLERVQRRDEHRDQDEA